MHCVIVGRGGVGDNLQYICKDIYILHIASVLMVWIRMKGVFTSLNLK